MKWIRNQTKLFYYNGHEGTVTVNVEWYKEMIEYLRNRHILFLLSTELALLGSKFSDCQALRNGKINNQSG